MSSSIKLSDKVLDPRRGRPSPNGWCKGFSGLVGFLPSKKKAKGGVWKMEGKMGYLGFWGAFLEHFSFFGYFLWCGKYPLILLPFEKVIFELLIT